MARKPVQKKSATKKGKKGGKKAGKRTYRPYVTKVVKGIQPAGKWRISKKALQVANSFAQDIFDRVATEAGKLLKHAGLRKLSSRSIQAAIRLVLPSELAKHAMQAGAKAVAKA